MTQEEKKNSIIRPQNTKNAGKETRIHKTRERWKETVASKRKWMAFSSSKDKIGKTRDVKGGKKIIIGKKPYYRLMQTAI